MARLSINSESSCPKSLFLREFRDCPFPDLHDPVIRFPLTYSALFLLCGCALPGMGVGNAPAPVTNPILVTTNNEELLWERAVDVLHDYHFEIARENRLGKVIETEPMVGSGVLEPWHPDAPDLPSRIEGTLQSIRRIAQISMQPDSNQRGYLISVAVYKEIEDLPGIAANSPGAATFAESEPLQRDLDPVVGESTPSGWISLGRDLALEQSILRKLHLVYSL